MSGFVRAVESSKIPASGLLTIEVNGESVLIARIDGEFYGMGAICNHEQWDLSEGSLSGHRVTCAGHGSVWDLRTGKAEFDEPLKDEPLYDVKEDDGILFIRKH